MDPGLRFLGTLKRRSVFKVAAAYVVSAWLIAQVAAVIVPAFAFPPWAMRGVLIALAIGFPIACGLAWAYELTADGVRRDRGDAPIRASASVQDAPSERSAEGGPGAGQLASRESLLVVVALSIAIIGGVTTLFTAEAPTAPHLAVLPFRVVGTEPDAQVLAAGLVESFTSTVTQFAQFDDALWVVPAAEITASMTPSAARQRFGVALVISGSIQLDQERARLTLNLIDAETERQVRSRQVDVRRQNIIDLQDEATRHLAGILNVDLSDREAASLRRGQTLHPDARRLYLKGRGILRQATSVGALDEAVGHFRDALAADTTFALAYAGLGEAYWQKYVRTDEVAWVDAALQASRRSLAVDSTLAPVWVTLGIIRSDQRHDEAAITAFERAIAIDPRYADAYRHLATVHRRRGDWRQAETTYRRAITLQPEYWKGYNLLGAFYYGQGRYAEAIAQYQHGLRLAPANPALLNNVAVAYWQMHRLDDAMAMFERILALDATRLSAQSNLATAYFYLGRFDDAARLYDQTLQQLPSDYELVGALADAQSWSTRHQDDAPASYRRAIRLATEHLSFRGQDPLVAGSLAQYYARLAQPDSARHWLGAVEALVDSSATDVVLSFAIGELYESLGDRTKALAWMRRALDHDYGWIPLLYSPWLADLRSDPRVQRLIEAEQARRDRASAPPGRAG